VSCNPANDAVLAEGKRVLIEDPARFDGVKVAPPSASATSPTTSHDHCSRPADSDPNYTLDREEPVNVTRDGVTQINERGHNNCVDILSSFFSWPAHSPYSQVAQMLLRTEILT
jgi:hypothetical protein